MTIQNVLMKSTATDPGSSTGTGAAAGSTAAGAAGASSASDAAQSSQDASDRFLTLLVAQLQNQDPLNPLDNAQVTTQLAQISTVSGINQLNATVAALGASMAASQTLQAASLVGRDVVVGGKDIDLLTDKTSGSASAEGGVSLGSDADSVKVTISDESGNVVRTLDLGAQKAGDQFFDWDGKTDGGGTAKDGHYTFAVTATAAGKAVTFDTLMSARVQGVASTSSGLMLQLPDGSQVAFADVKQIH
jgi:flagellar basal-body rod modification protein FlgD